MVIACLLSSSDFSLWWEAGRGLGGRLKTRVRAESLPEIVGDTGTDRQTKYTGTDTQKHYEHLFFFNQQPSKICMA